MRFDPANTSVSNGTTTGDTMVHDFFVLFMGNFLRSLDPKKNPYILGYSSEYLAS
jgi:hypothetical protein